MKRVLFDLSVCQPIGKSRFHGGGVYGYIVFKHLCIRNSRNLVAYINPEAFIPNEITEVLNDKSILTFYSTENSIIEAYKKSGCDIIYSPLYKPSYKSIIKSSIPLTITIHGLRALEMNRDKYEWLYYNNSRDILKSFVKQTPLFRFITKKYYNSYLDLFEYDKAKIITVSNHSKASILNYYPTIPSERITVRYSPNTSNHSSQKTSKLTQRNERYYLIISANRWLKNAYRALLAFDRFFENNPHSDFKVYVIGIKGNNRMYRKLKHKTKYVLFDYVDREKLESLYNESYCLVYPSLNEGFGYPPIEAMRYSTPVITSGIASIPEICGDSVLYFSPYSVEEISNRIIQMENKAIRDIYAEKARKKYEEIVMKQNADLDLLTLDIMG